MEEGARGLGAGQGCSSEAMQGMLFPPLGEIPEVIPFFFFFVFLGLQLRHMEVPRLGI